MNMSDSKLKPSQERFCQEYLKDLNATQAAIRAGYENKNADVTGPRLLRNVGIASRIKDLINERSKRTEITADVVLKELLLIAKTDLSQAYDDNGHLKSIHDIPEDVRRAISGIKVFEEFEGYGKDRVKIGETREVKLWDKTRALELLGKHLKLFTEKIDQTTSVTHKGEITVNVVDIQDRINQLKKQE